MQFIDPDEYVHSMKKKKELFCATPTLPLQTFWGVIW